MSRLPPSLVCLSIWNSTLKPVGPIDPDDEDAEEQAHILFYTSNERATSRDKMLRQVGLAKALINFSEIFNADTACENIHSQSRRMVLLSPEPNFWIMATVQLARTPHQPTIGKAKGKDKANQSTIYDYHDGSVHDNVLKAYIQRGYERFKLTHGSLTRVLSELGKEPLELQLERFFTVWAWSWSLEDRPDFNDHMGIPLHPSSKALLPMIDEYAAQDNIVVLQPPHVIPSTTYLQSNLPPSLVHHLLSLIPPPPMSTLPSSKSIEATARATTSRPTPSAIRGEKATIRGESPQTNMTAGFMNTMTTIPAAMNPTKWGWPGYLTFGAGKMVLTTPPNTQAPPTAGPGTPSVDETKDPIPPQPILNLRPDPAALTEALSSSHKSEQASSEDSKSIQPAEAQDSDVPVPSLSDDAIPSSSDEVVPLSSDDTVPSDVERPPSPPPAPTYKFLSTPIHLAENDDPLSTHRERVYFIIKDYTAIAYIGLNPDEEQSQLDALATRTADFISSLKDRIEKETPASPVDLTASRILQTQDRHLISQDPFNSTTPTRGFSSSSEHLYNAQALQDRDPSITEIFSRGQNPQHWHVARRGLGVDNAGNTVDGEVYLEVERKEASLTDVDNVLAGIIRRFVG